MGTFSLILWSLVGIHLLWFAVCIALKAAVHTRDPGSWHYRLLAWVSLRESPPPTDSCRYFGKLMITPHVALLICVLAIIGMFVVCLIGIGVFIDDWVWKPIFMGELLTRINEKPVSHPLNGIYWSADGMFAYGKKRYRKIVPVTPLLLYLLVGFCWIFGSSALHMYAGNSGPIETYFVSVILCIAILTILGILLFVPSKPKMLWEALTNKLCWELTDINEPKEKRASDGNE